MRQVKVTDTMTQNEIVLKHLEQNPKQGITPMIAFEFYGITRLGGRIFELRKAGADIQSTQETVKAKNGKARNYARYTLAAVKA